MFSTFYPAAERETAFSLLATACLGTTSCQTHHALALAFRRCSPMLYTLPTRVKLFCELTNCSYGNAKDILRSNCLYPYFCAGLSEATQLKLKSQLIEGVMGRTCAPHLPVLYDSTNRYGLDCPECTSEIQGLIGRRASLCHICIPLATCCAVHNCPLVITDSCSASELIFTRRSSTIPSTNDLQFARKSWNLCLESFQFDYRKNLSSLMIEKRYATPDGRARLFELNRDFRNFFSAGFDDVRLTTMIRELTIPTLVIRNLAREERGIHPVFLTLMYWFLESADTSSLPMFEKWRQKRSYKKKSEKYQPTEEQLQRKRREWLEHNNKPLNRTRTEIRLTAVSLWTWLYRYDRCWLEHHQAEGDRPKGKKGAAKVPRSLMSMLIKHSAPPPDRENLPPRRDSAYQSRLTAGLNDYVFRRVSSDSFEIGYGAQTPGAKEIWISRRIEWAIGDLLRHGETLNEGKIALRASIRIETLRHYLKKT